MRFFHTLLILLMCSSGACAQPQPQIEDCSEAYEEICENLPNLNIAEFTQCLKKNLAKIPAECQASAREQIKKYGEYGEGCGKDVKKLCGYNLNSLFPPDQKKAQKIYSCLIANWKKLSEGCQAYVRVSIPFFPIIEEGLQEQEWIDLRQNPKKKVKIAGTDKTVDAVLQEGDVVWYEAKLIERKVVERYPFCPEVKDKGLKLMINHNSHTCYYEIKDEIKQKVIMELRSQNLLERVDYLGARRLKSAQDEGVVVILDKYSTKCPQGFFIDVFNDHDTNNQQVLCKPKERQDCDYSNGWRTSYPKEGMLGCKRLPKCSDMNPSYHDFDYQQFCAECFAGGCLDLKKSQNYTDDPQMYCKVNTQDPQN